jgi:D-beta-D-heptose 7-phosphate kinase / D-beta-D-heptose 1-phosphate adenosyltransferase
MTHPRSERSQKLRQLGAFLRRQRKRIVFTNGCFDLLHAGHVDYLEKARKLGDVLVVGLNSDRSVRRLKGAGRPMTRQSDRVKVLKALSCVDYVIPFNEATPIDLIRAIQPHYLVKGSDWQRHKISGANEILSWGGKVKRIKLLPGRSTTEIIKKAQCLTKQ